MTPTTNRNKNSMALTSTPEELEHRAEETRRLAGESPLLAGATEHLRQINEDLEARTESIKGMTKDLEEITEDVQSVIDGKAKLAQSALQEMPDQELLDMLLAGQVTCEDEVFGFLLERCLTIAPELKSVSALGVKLEEQLKSLSSQMATLRVESSAYAKDMVNRYRKVTKTE